jgi:hypothetical protein
MMRSLALLACLALIGCGTLFADKTRPVLLQSSPPGAQVTVDGMPVGVAPVTVGLDNHKSHVVSFSRGGRAASCVVSASPGALWVVLDIIFLPALLPIIIDAVTGGWNEIGQPTCAVFLE